MPPSLGEEGTYTGEVEVELIRPVEEEGAEDVPSDAGDEVASAEARSDREDDTAPQGGKSRAFRMLALWWARATHDRGTRITLLLLVATVLVLELGVAAIAGVMRQIGEDVLSDNLGFVLDAHALALGLDSRIAGLSLIAPYLAAALQSGLVQEDFSFTLGTPNSTLDAAAHLTQRILASGVELSDPVARGEAYAAYCGLPTGPYISVETINGTLFFVAPMDTPIVPGTEFLSGFCLARMEIGLAIPWTDYVEGLWPSDLECMKEVNATGCWWSDLGNGTVPEHLALNISFCSYNATLRPWWTAAAAEAAQIKALSFGSDKRAPAWGFSSWSEPYVATAGSFVTSAVTPVFSSFTSRQVVAMCAMDLDMATLRQELNDFKQNRTIDDDAYIMLFSSAGRMLAVTGPDTEGLPAVEVTEMNILSGTNLVASLETIGDTMREQFGLGMPATESASWLGGGDSSRSTTWFKDGLVFSVSPLDATLDQGLDCYVAIIVPIDAYRTDVVGAVLRTSIVAVLVAIVVLAVEGVVVLSHKYHRMFEASTTFMIGPQRFRYGNIVTTAIVLLGFVGTFAIWVGYTNALAEEVVRDGALAFRSAARLQTTSYFLPPVLALTINAIAVESGMISARPSTDAEYAAVDTFLSSVHMLFPTARFVGVGTADAYHGTMRRTDLRLSGEAITPVTALQLAAVDPLRPEDANTWTYSPLELSSDERAFRRNLTLATRAAGEANLNDTGWYQLGRSTIVPKWTRPYAFVDGSAGATIIKAVNPAYALPTVPTGAIVEVSPDLAGIDSFLASASPIIRTFILEREADAKLLGVSHGSATLKDEGQQLLLDPVSEDADPLIQYLANGLLNRFGGFDSIPCAWEGIIGEEDPESTTRGRFFVAYNCIGTVSNWAVVTAYRSDTMLASQRIALRQSIVLVLGLVTLILGSVKVVKSVFASGSGAPATAEPAAATPHQQRGDDGREPLISNEEVENAAKVLVAETIGQLLTRLRYCVKKNLSVIYGEPGSCVDLVAKAYEMARRTTAFSVDMELQIVLEAAYGPRSVPTRLVRLLASDRYETVVILASALHCVTALLQSREPGAGLLAVDGILIAFRLFHSALRVYAAVLERRHVQRERSSSLLLFLRVGGVLALAVDYVWQAASGASYGAPIAVTAWLRPLLFAVETTRLMSAVQSFVCTVLVSYSVFVLFAVFLFVAAVLSVALFRQDDGFNNLFSAFFAMFNFMATLDNYQDVVEGTAGSNATTFGWNMLFFGTFSAVGFFVFLSLVVAVFQETFSTAHIALTNLERARRNTPLMVAFLVMVHGARDLQAHASASEGGGADDEDVGGKDDGAAADAVRGRRASGARADPDVVEADDEVLPMRTAVAFLERRRPELGLRAEAWLRRRGSVSFTEFSELVEQLDALVMTETPVRRVLQDGSVAYVDDSWGARRRAWALYMQRPSWSSFVLVSCTLAGWLLAAQGALGGGPDSTLVGDGLCYAIFLLHTVEVGTRAAVMGRSLFLRVPNDTIRTMVNTVELAVMGVAFFTMAAVQIARGQVIPPNAEPSALRLLYAAPLFRTFLVGKGTRLLLLSILRVLRIYGEHVLTILEFGVLYALLSTLLLSDVFAYEHSADFDVSIINFDTPIVSLITLYQVTLQANWSSVTEAASAVLGEWVEWYFMTYIFIQGILLLNLFAGVLCDAFASVDDCRALIAELGGRITLHRMWRKLEGRDDPALLVWVDPVCRRLFVVAEEAYTELASAFRLVDDSGPLVDDDSDEAADGDDGQEDGAVKHIADLRRVAVAAEAAPRNRIHSVLAVLGADEQAGMDEVEELAPHEQSYAEFGAFVERVERADLHVRSLAALHEVPVPSVVELPPEMPPALAAALESDRFSDDAVIEGMPDDISPEAITKMEEVYLGQVSKWAERRLRDTLSVARSLNERLNH